ncbi:EamA family transporter [Nostocoides sp. F2B08]|uniref:EamA family transporter n=1 Tax=Nostocoides sp. F2B08 TaxID=2653936 RepID=UPI0012633376|nr:DMT family transporter [Tetrasphaera sp. F2B08]KAB7743512.1 EamA family transporter [Tetrasphaera sp. F2B08]
MVDAVRRQFGSGLLALLLSSAAFGTSGPFAKSLIEAGWSPPLVVFLRMLGASVVLLPFAWGPLRRHWRTVGDNLPLVVSYGLLAVGAAQLGYFQAVQRLPVGVALLLEFLGIVLVVLVMWFISRITPHRLTFLGIALALGGLALVLDVLGASTPDLVGVAWGLFSAVGLAGHFLLAGRPNPVPSIAFACLGLFVGALALGALGLVGLLPMEAGDGAVTLAGASAPAWLAFAELVLVAAALAYVLGIVGARRLGSTVASFVGLTEVLFAILVAWLLLGELPRPVQLVGGVLILGGVVAVRLGEARREAEQAAAAAAALAVPGSEEPHVTDFSQHEPVP